MLSKVNRLKKRYQFNYVYKNGSHFSSSALVLYVSTSKTRSIKVGFAVTKKIGKAVQRNAVRRRLREIVQKQLPNLKQNYNIILVARDNVSEFSFESLSKQFLDLVKKADILRDEKNS